MDTGCDRCGCCVSGAEEYGIIYDVVNMNREMFMGCVARMPRVRYSVAYPSGRECMLRRETKTTVAIYCGNHPVSPWYPMVSHIRKWLAF